MLQKKKASRRTNFAGRSNSAPSRKWLIDRSSHIRASRATVGVVADDSVTQEGVNTSVGLNRNSTAAVVDDHVIREPDHRRISGHPAPGLDAMAGIVRELTERKDDDGRLAVTLGVYSDVV